MLTVPLKNIRMGGSSNTWNYANSPFKQYKDGGGVVILEITLTVPLKNIRMGGVVILEIMLTVPLKNIRMGGSSNTNPQWSLLPLMILTCFLFERFLKALNL